MKKNILATKEIIAGNRSVENVSYSTNGDSMEIWFSHCATNEAGDFVPTTWEHVAENNAHINEISFAPGGCIQIYDISNRSWKNG